MSPALYVTSLPTTADPAVREISFGDAIREALYRQGAWFLPVTLVANQFLATSAALRRAFGLGHEDVLIVLTVALGNVQRMLRTPDAEGLAVSTALVEQERIVPARFVRLSGRYGYA